MWGLLHSPGFALSPARAGTRNPPKWLYTSFHSITSKIRLGRVTVKPQRVNHFSSRSEGDYLLERLEYFSRGILVKFEFLFVQAFFL